MEEAKKLKLGIVGVTGYGGAELVRILLNHPSFQLSFGTSTREAGKKIHEIHPNLLGRSDLEISDHPVGDESIWDELDGVFLAMPHGQSMNLVPKLPSHLKVVDLAGDYRIKDYDVFTKHYGKDHPDFERQASFAYGLTEINRHEVTKSRLVANPGCFATAVQLALLPLVKSGLLEDFVVVDAKTGSSGSGAVPRSTTHHPFRSSAFYAYKLLAHQHLPEIEQSLKGAGFSGETLFQVHSAPMTRGIFASQYAKVKRDVSIEELTYIYENFYEGSPFIRLRKGSPNVSWVAHTNFVDIGFGISGRNVAVFSAIDNLVKGAAGQAVQNMNLMMGFNEELGLNQIGGHPT